MSLAFRTRSKDMHRAAASTIVASFSIMYTNDIQVSHSPSLFSMPTGDERDRTVDRLSARGLEALSTPRHRRMSFSCRFYAYNDETLAGQEPDTFRAYQVTRSGNNRNHHLLPSTRATDGIKSRGLLMSVTSIHLMRVAVGMPCKGLNHPSAVAPDQATRAPWRRRVPEHDSDWAPSVVPASRTSSAIGTRATPTRSRPELGTKVC